MNSATDIRVTEDTGNQRGQAGLSCTDLLADGRKFQSAFLAGDSTEDREPCDFYKTPEHATLAILERERFEGWIWEPACGDGAISRLLESRDGERGKVTSSDLHDRGYGDPNVDFLNTYRKVSHVITNPPYRLAQEFVEHALQCASGKVAMLLKLNFLEGQRRKPFFASTPLRTVYVFSKRISFDKGNVAGKGNGLLAYAWFVWEHGYVGKPTIEWI